MKEPSAQTPTQTRPTRPLPRSTATRGATLPIKRDNRHHTRGTKPLDPLARAKAHRLRAMRHAAQQRRRFESPTLPEPATHAGKQRGFSATYIDERLTRSISEAQIQRNYREAIRLQLLQWRLEDEQLSPVAVARQAWLRPAANK